MMSYKVIKTLDSEEQKKVEINHIDKKYWVKHYKQLRFDKNTKDTDAQSKEVKELDVIDKDKVKEALKTIRNRKATGLDGLNVKL